MSDIFDDVKSGKVRAMVPEPMGGLWNEGVILTFGESTDADTVQTFFGQMARANYLVQVNGVDVIVTDVTGGDDRLTLEGWLTDGIGNSTGEVVVTPWDEIQTLHIY